MENEVATYSQEYSPNTLIISLEQNVSDEAVYALASRYDMEVIYLYENFDMCAVKLPQRLSDQQFARLIKRLEKEPEVVAAMRDGIMHLD